MKYVLRPCKLCGKPFRTVEHAKRYMCHVCLALPYRERKGVFMLRKIDELEKELAYQKNNYAKWERSSRRSR